MVVSCLVFKGITKLFSRVGVPFYISAKIYAEPRSLYPLQHLVLSLLVSLVILIGVR